MARATNRFGVPVNEDGHDLNLTKDTLVVAVQDTTEGCKEGQGETFAVVKETSPSRLLRVVHEERVKVAPACCAAAHVVCRIRSSVTVSVILWLAWQLSRVYYRWSV